MITEETARAALDSAVHGVVLVSDGMAECNAHFCRMLEWQPRELTGKPILELCPDLQADGALSSERWQRRCQAASAGLPQWFPWQFRSRGGRRVHALVHLYARDGAGADLVAHVHDLSNLREAPWIKPETRARLQDVLEHTKAVIFVKDREGRYVFANRELERAVRLPARRIIGRNDADIWPAEFAERFRASDAQVLLQQSATEFEATGTLGGHSLTFLCFEFPLFSVEGHAYGVCFIATDITERKRTQDALTKAALAVSSAQGSTVFQELVRYLATILEVDMALIATPCPDGRLMRVHAFYLDGESRENFEYNLQGTPCETVLGRRFRIYPSGLREKFPGDDVEQLSMESYAGFPLNDANGEPIGLIGALSRQPLVNGEFIESVMKIFAVRAGAELERQRSEETLRRSEASYRAIFEASEDAIFIHDWDTGRVVDVNRRACEIYGYTYEELKGIRVADVSSGEHPYTAQEAGRLLDQARSGKPLHFEWHRRNKDGSLHWDEVVVRPAVIAGERRLVAFTREITERKQAEQALRQAQKMEALGHLTGGIAHDFNNLLTSIMGYVVLAADHPTAGTDARLQKYLEQAQASCVRARDLIQQMLTFSRGQRGQPRPVALAPLVSQGVKLFGASFPATVRIDTSLDADVPPVMLDPVHLDQILLNLCLNARDAMNGSGTIRVSVRQAREHNRVCTACRQSANGAFVELSVQDNGPGIPAGVIDRIFEPFFTTKDVGKGSGMGLSSVHGIVHELGGHIVVDTEIGRGTCFRVLLPEIEGAAVVADPGGNVSARPPRPHLSGRVLVVDDEKAVGAFMRDLLESWDLEVTLATNGPDAAARVAAEPERFDLVITDQMMPGMTGVQLGTELAKLQPDLPVILYTGFNEGITPAEIEAAHLRAVATKPIEPHQLFGLLRTHLPSQR